jgi:DNA-binding transcriptional ArsR family regulator
MDALGDATRRTVLERLAAGPSSVGRLAEGLPVSRPAVSQHLRVLREAGLVSDRRVGTRRVYEVNPAGIAAVGDYWNQFWSQALERYRVAAEAAGEVSGRSGSASGPQGPRTEGEGQDGQGG